jgi:hypothetical protein
MNGYQVTDKIWVGYSYRAAHSAKGTPVVAGYPAMRLGAEIANLIDQGIPLKALDRRTWCYRCCGLGERGVPITRRATILKTYRRTAPTRQMAILG